MEHILEMSRCSELLPAEPPVIAGKQSWIFGQTLDADDPRLIRLRSALQQKGVRRFERRENQYDESEIRSAPLLHFVVTTAPRQFGGPQCGTAYDLSQACPACGTDSTQVSALMAKASQLPKRALICQTLDHEYLVSADLEQSLRKSGISGLELRQVRSHKDQALLPWWQMIALTTMPRMAASTRGVIRGSPAPCPRCSRDGFFMTVTEPEEIVYNASEVDIERLPDCVQTWECFGKSGVKEPFHLSHFARPLMLVKPKVYEILCSVEVRGIEYIPVQVR